MRTASCEYQGRAGDLLCVKDGYKMTGKGGRTKSFAWRQPDGQGGWTKGRPPASEMLLYRLPSVLAAVASGADVYWCEGEKDADTVTRLGFCGTSHPDGAPEVGRTHATWLTGHLGHVFLLADRDAVGALDVLRRYEALRSIGLHRTQISMLQTPIDGCKDVTDHVLQGHGLHELVGVDLAAVQRAAATVTPRTVRATGYGGRA